MGCTTITCVPPLRPAGDVRSSHPISSLSPLSSFFAIRDEFPEGEFMEHINLEIVKAQRVSTPEGEAVVKGLIEKHAELTGSPKAKQVLANWEENLPRFWQLVPPGMYDKPNKKEGRFDCCRCENTHVWSGVLSFVYEITACPVCEEGSVCEQVSCVPFGRVRPILPPLTSFLRVFCAVYTLGRVWLLWFSVIKNSLSFG